MAGKGITGGITAGTTPVRSERQRRSTVSMWPTLASKRSKAIRLHLDSGGLNNTFIIERIEIWIKYNLMKKRKKKKTILHHIRIITSCVVSESPLYNMKMCSDQSSAV